MSLFGVSAVGEVLHVEGDGGAARADGTLLVRVRPRNSHPERRNTLQSHFATFPTPTKRFLLKPTTT